MDHHNATSGEGQEELPVSRIIISIALVVVLFGPLLIVLFWQLIAVRQGVGNEAMRYDARTHIKFEHDRPSPIDDDLQLTQVQETSE